MTIEEMKKLAEGATDGPWYRVEQPWLHSDSPTYVIAGSPDPHVGKMITDTDIDADDYDAELDRTWHDMGFIAASRTFVPEAIEAIEKMAEALHSVLRFEDGRANPNKVIVREIRESLAAYRRIGGGV